MIRKQVVEDHQDEPQVKRKKSSQQSCGENDEAANVTKHPKRNVNNGLSLIQ